MISQSMVRPICLALLSAVLLTPGGAVVYAGSGDLAEKRQAYRAALRALAAKDTGTFHELRNRLADYILRAHLDYAYLKDRIATTSPEVLHRFLEENQAAVVSEQLRKKWLDYLAKKGDWDTFLREYQEIRGDTGQRCRRLNRLLKAGGGQPTTITAVKELWLTGRRQPKACDALFGAAHKAGHLTPALVWARIKLAMERRNPGLAGALGKRYLAAKDRLWVRRWQAMHRRPGKELRRIRYPVKTRIARTIVRHGVVRLGRRDPESAMRKWESLNKKYQFSPGDENYVVRNLGIIAARQHLPVAVTWLAGVSSDHHDKELRSWRIRAASRAADWVRASTFVRSLTELERRDPYWRYLKARVLEKTGEATQAQRLFAALAQERNYYGFLAADRLNLPYAMQHQRVQAGPVEIQAIESRPSVKIARELFTLGETIAARRQWTWATRRMNSRELQVAAWIASRWGWHDRAILTLNDSGYRDDLDLRFPLLYQELVETNAKRENIDSEWIYGVLRQESAFITDARSRAGALGLMQLMPRTGRQVGRRIKLKVRGRGTILKVENNIRLGTNYLKAVLDRFRGSQILATAAYNAGPHRVKRWLPDTSNVAADLWVESIPFNETRNYVKNVMGFATIYDYRLGNQQTRLRERMPPVTPYSKIQ